MLSGPINNARFFWLKLLRSLPPVAAFVLTFFFFGPSQLFLGNSVEFPYVYFVLLISLLPIGIIFSISLACVVSSLPEKHGLFQKALALIFALSAALWLQGNILVWNYGRLTGAHIDWNAHPLIGIIDSGIWILLIAYALVKTSIVNRWAGKLSILLILIQVVSVSLIAYRQPAPPDFKKYVTSEEDKFVYSRNVNVIVIVLDMFQSDVFQEIINEDSQYSKIFDGFTYFRNALGGYPSTYPSISTMLTGQYYDNSQPVQNFLKGAFLSKASVPNVLNNNNFRVGMYGSGMSINFDRRNLRHIRTKRHLSRDEMLYLLDLAAFRYLPHFLKQRVYNNGNWMLEWIFSDAQNVTGLFSDKAFRAGVDLRFMSNFVQSSKVSTDDPVFKLYHFHGAHTPFIINEKLEFEEMGDNRAAYKRQAKGALQLTRIFLDKLREKGVYDNAFIVIAADHGFPSSWMGVMLPPDMKKISQSSVTNSDDYRGYGLPLILVKSFNAKGGLRVSDAPVTLSDIPKTIFDGLGISGQFPGEVMMQLDESRRRKRFFYYYDWDSDISSDYLPAMKEYEVSGFSWLPESWQFTGRVFARNGLQYPNRYHYGALIRFGADGNSKPYQERGWSIDERGGVWTDGKKAVLNMRIDKPNGDMVLQLSQIPYVMKGKLERQRVVVYANRESVAEWNISSAGEQKAVIPKDAVQGGRLEIAFELPEAVAPNAISLQNSDERILGLFVTKFHLDESSSHRLK